MPTESYAQLSEALARITAAASPASLWAAVKDYAAPFGYSYLLVIDAARLVAGFRDAAIYSEAPPELFQAVERELPPYERHPIVLEALSTETPFLVSDIRSRPEHKGARWTELVVDVIKKGDGLVIPIWRKGEPLAGFNFGGEKGDASGIARALLHVASYAAIERLLELREGKPATGLSLSVRETQCLRHVAIGHPDAEIGRLLGISPRTVRFHVDSAKAKLGVTSRVQAVAKALRERIIAV